MRSPRSERRRGVPATRPGDVGRVVPWWQTRLRAGRNAAWLESVRASSTEAQVVIRAPRDRRVTLHVRRTKPDAGAPSDPVANAGRVVPRGVDTLQVNQSGGEETAVVVEVAIGRTDNVEAASERSADRCA